MAADETTPKDPSGSVERQVSNLLEYLQGPIKQVQEWVGGGELQSKIEHLQEQAGRAQEGVERRLRALGEVRQGLEVHVRKQLEAYRREKKELIQRAEDASVEEPAAPPPAAARKASNQTGPPVPARPKTKPAAKKTGTKRPTGRKQ